MQSCADSLRDGAGVQHRSAATSPRLLDPDEYGVRRRGRHPDPTAVRMGGVLTTRPRDVGPAI